MSDDIPLCEIESNALGNLARESRVTNTQLAMIVLLLTVAMIIMHFLSYATTGLLAQVISFFQSCVGLVMVVGALLVRLVIVKRARLSDIAIRVGKRVIRIGDPSVVDEQLFSRLEGLFRTYRSVTRDLRKSITEIETLAKMRQDEIEAANAVLEAMHSEKSKLNDEILALKETRPEAYAFVKGLFEEQEEKAASREEKVKWREGLYLLIGAFLQFLIERIAARFGV